MNKRSEELTTRLAAVRRDHLLDAATRVFARKGFNGATIHDVARQAGVADGTIYNYFNNKEALLFGILDRLNETEQRQQDLARPADAEADAFVRTYVRHRFDVFERVGLDALQVLLSEVLVNPPLRERYLRDIIEPTFAIADAAVETWAASATYDPRLATRANAALVLGCLVLRLCGERLLTERWDEVPDLVADMILTSQGGRHGKPAAD
jgi:AcrR family transcriptional regulator